MALHVTTRWGADEPEPTVARLREVLQELDSEDDEHPSVDLTDESSWSLGAFPNGLLVWQNLEAGPPRHMKNVSRSRMLELWVKLLHGEIADIEAEPWLPGHGN